jgi:hypothetical protein
VGAVGELVSERALVGARPAPFPHDYHPGET